MAEKKKPASKAADKKVEPGSLPEQFQAAKKGKKTKVEFIESPTGALGLAYHVGDKADFSKSQADMLIELGLAKPV